MTKTLKRILRMPTVADAILKPKMATEGGFTARNFSFSASKDVSAYVLIGHLSATSHTLSVQSDMN